MKKVTTAIIAIAVLIILVISVQIFSKHEGHEVATTTDGAVKSFIEMMIPHHTEAVETSKVIMMDSAITKPEIRLFAARVADAQEFEITQMQGWYQEWFKAEYMFDPSMYNPMMTDTGDLTGDVRAKIYLRDMIKHHEHAIEEAENTRKLITDLQNTNTTTDGTISITNSHPGIDTTLVFAEHIKTVQQKEIEEMKDLLDML